MKVTEQDVLYVADLANLELTEQERRRMLKDLNSILDYMDMLGELDTSNVEPMAQVVTLDYPTRAERGTRLRPDEVRTGLSHEAALMNAPDTDGTYFKVPKVIDKSGGATE